MESIIKKTVHDLTSSEKEQIATLIREYYLQPDNVFIDYQIEKDRHFEIYMIKEGETVLGLNMYKARRAKTPFSKKVIPVVHFGLAVKKRGYRKNVIKRLGMKFGNEKIGWFHPIKRMAALSTICSPRVFEHFIKWYPAAGEILRSGPNQEHVRYLNDFYPGPDELRVDAHCCLEFPGVQKHDITKNWERMHKSHRPEINQLFFDLGILEQEGDQVFRNGRHLVAFGYRAPLHPRVSILKKSVNTSASDLPSGLATS